MVPSLPEPPITTRSIEAVEAIHRFGGELLSHGCRCDAIFAAVAADPDCALAQAYAAAIFLFRMTREGQVQATPRLRIAEALAADASPREQRIVAAIARWGAGDVHAAARLLDEVVAEWPHDLVSAKMCQILQLDIGDFAAMRRTAARAVAAEPDSGYALGLFAFALEQTGDADRAEALGRRAIERNPLMDPWAQHAVAHVHAAREEWAEGRAFLRGHAPSWDRCSSFMLTHNWWHAALFSLRLGDPAGALRLFDERVWGVRKDHCQDQANAISLLARLELRGVDAGTRWADVAVHVARHIEGRVSGFMDLHYLLALVRAGEDEAADRLALELAGRARTDPLDSVAVLARGILAHARRDWRTAAEAFGQARGRLIDIGGSNVQRELFEELLFDSLSHMRDERPLTRSRSRALAERSVMSVLAYA